MKITLVKPNMGRRGEARYVDSGRMEPLQLGVLAGLTPPEYQVEIVDDRIDLIDFDARTATVIFDTAATSADAIATASANAGYPARVAG